jgi:tetratricopeptide (TPR) repeat protein
MSMREFFTALLMLALSATAFAAPSDEYSALIRERKFAEVEKLTTQRLATNPNDASAAVGKIRAILAAGNDKRIDEAVKLSERCVELHAKSSECHEMLGSSLGTKALDAGIMAAMGYAGKIRESFKTAVDLDPSNWSARSALIQYYLAAPGIVGGGKDKAKAAASDAGLINPEAGKLFNALLLIRDEKPAEAQSLLQTVKTPDSPDLLDLLRTGLVGTGSLYLKLKNFDEANRVFTNISSRFPGSSWGVYGLGRVAQEQGKHDEALAHYAKALGIQANGLTHFRIGQTHQAAGDKAAAISSFEKAISVGGLSKNQREDAVKRLQQLKA